MAVKWLEIAQKMAETARARVAADRKQLREILANRPLCSPLRTRSDPTQTYSCRWSQRFREDHTEFRRKILSRDTGRGPSLRVPCERWDSKTRSAVGLAPMPNSVNSNRVVGLIGEAHAI